MTITAPRSAFRRSTERRVTDPNEQLVIEADRRHQVELQRFEEVGFSAAAASVLVEPLQLEARRYSCRTEDEGTYSKDGWVR